MTDHANDLGGWPNEQGYSVTHHTIDRDHWVATGTDLAIRAYLSPGRMRGRRGRLLHPARHAFGGRAVGSKCYPRLWHSDQL